MATNHRYNTRLGAAMRASGKCLTWHDLYHDGACCALCGVAFTDDDRKAHRISLDHKTPLSRGGTHTEENLQLAHVACNRAKGDKEIAA